jgi:hypothetical protein
MLNQKFISYSNLLNVYASKILLWTKCRHNLFLHSALVLSRKVPNSVRGINVSHSGN